MAAAILDLYFWLRLGDQWR